MGLPWWLSGKESACSAGDVSLTPGKEDQLEKKMATNCSILAWEIPWAEEPGRLQFMGLQRVRLDLATKQQLIHSSTVQKSGKPENNPIIN